MLLGFFEGGFVEAGTELLSHSDAYSNHLSQGSQLLVRVSGTARLANDILQAIVSVNRLSVVTFSTLEGFGEVYRWLVCFSRQVESVNATLSYH